MNILMISDVYFPRVNGVSTSIRTFRDSLGKMGHSSTLIAPSYGDDAAEDSLIRIASRYLFMDPEDRLMKIGRIESLTRHLREQRFDIIHIQTPFAAHLAGMRLSRALKLPVVETYHTHFEEYFYHYLPLLPKSVMRLAARALTRHQANQVDALIVPSLAMKSVLRDYGIATPTSIVPTGLSLDEFNQGDRKAFCEMHGVDPRRPILVHIGRVAMEKNIGFLLDVIAEVRLKLPDIMFIIAGEGPAQAALESRVLELNLEHHVIFIGYLDRGQDLWDCYSAGDAFIFASNTETQGLVLLEAMALGVPVVSTAILGTRDILDAGKGALVAQPDVIDFSTRVLQLLSDKELGTRLAAEGRNYAKSWSTEVMTERLIAFYSRTIQHWSAQHCSQQPASEI